MAAAAYTSPRVVLTVSPSDGTRLAVRDFTGDKVPDLTLGHSISGSVDLTPAEAEALRKGMIYVQIHSEGAPDGNLRGWLLK